MLGYNGLSFLVWALKKRIKMIVLKENHTVALDDVQNVQIELSFILRCQ